MANATRLGAHGGVRRGRACRLPIFKFVCWPLPNGIFHYHTPLPPPAVQKRQRSNSDDADAGATAKLATSHGVSHLVAAAAASGATVDASPQPDGDVANPTGPSPMASPVGPPRLLGVVTAFSSGHGFIRQLNPDGSEVEVNGGPVDVFVHFKAIVADAEGVFRALHVGQQVSFVLDSSSGRVCAGDVRAPNGGPAVVAEPEPGQWHCGCRRVAVKAGVTPKPCSHLVHFGACLSSCVRLPPVEVAPVRRETRRPHAGCTAACSMFVVAHWVMRARCPRCGSTACSAATAACLPFHASAMFGTVGSSVLALPPSRMCCRCYARPTPAPRHTAASSKYPEVAWDVDPASVLSNTAPALTELEKSDPRRCPDPVNVLWHSESWAGRKPTQEDRFSNGRTRLRGLHLRYFGVFDGHGGCMCSEFLRKRLHNAVMKCVRQAPRPRRRVQPGTVDADVVDVTKASLTEAFATLDSEFLTQAKRDHLDDGSTALVTMLLGNSEDNMSIVVANAGDCRAVLCRGGALYACVYRYVYVCDCGAVLACMWSSQWGWLICAFVGGHLYSD